MKPLYSTPVMFKPMNPQPNWVFLNEGDAPDEYEPGVFVWYAPYPAGEDGGDVDWRGEFHKAPYRPGEKCYVPEAWCKSIIEGIIYKDGYDVPDAPRWRSPATMPMWAARRFVTILSCEAVRVRNISEEDARASGITDGGCLNCGEHEPCGCDDPQPSPRETFLFDWNERHPGKEWAWRVESEEETIGTN